MNEWHTQRSESKKNCMTKKLREAYKLAVSEKISALYSLYI